MDRKEFKQINGSIKFLQQGFEDLNKRNYEFYEFIESNYYDLEERLTIRELKVKDLSRVRKA